MFSHHPTASSLAAEQFGFSAPVDTDPASEACIHGYPCRRQRTVFGTYITVSVGDCGIWSTGDSRGVVGVVAEILRQIAPDTDGCTLVCGIGNRSITADALGPMVCDRLSAAFSPLCIFAPGVAAKTGIPTVPLLHAIAEVCHARRIIAVDALAAKSRDTLGRVIQLSGDAITPGGGSGIHAEEISARTMPCPVCTIGVPTVIRASALCGSDVTANELFVTDSAIDSLVERYAQGIAGGIARYLAGG